MGVDVLVVEDDERIGASVEQVLSAAGYGVTRVRTGEDAFFLATTQRFDLMVLDLGLPGRDGLEVLDALRARDRELPVLILSARAGIPDRVLGLQRGADDYLSKPFSLAELEARLQVLLRRGRPDLALRISVHDLTLDIALRTVTRAGRPIELTGLELDLLALLMRRAHSAVSRESIASEIWKEVNRATPLDNVIDVHIGRIRRKVDLPGQRTLIHTVRGLGFMLTEKQEP